MAITNYTVFIINCAMLLRFVIKNDVKFAKGAPHFLEAATPPVVNLNLLEG